MRATYRASGRVMAAIFWNREVFLRMNISVAI